MLNKLRTNLRTLGMRDTLYYLLTRLLSAITRGRARLVRYLIVAQPVSQAPLLPTHKGHKISVREIAPGDPMQAHFPVPAHVIEARWRQGARCLLATHDGKFVGYLWWVTGRYREDEIRLTFELPQHGAAWDFDVYVEPAYRLGYAFMRLWDEAYARLRTQGVKTSFSRISAFNVASRAAHQRLQARPRCTLTCLQLGSLELSFCSQTPYVLLSWGQRAPVLELR